MNPTGRFSTRVDFYVRYRPGYPDAALRLLHDAIPAGGAVADIGSGTGISSRWLAQRAALVYAVEPNAEMRQAAGDAPGIVPVHGTAEATGLADASVDAVVCATAFHWFRIEESRAEFQRILRPNGNTVLIWNIRDREASAFQRGYEDLIAEFAIDYTPEWDHGSSASVDRYFDGRPYQSASVPNAQVLDWEGLRGRALSASYSPLAGHPNHEPFLQKLQQLFETYQTNRVIRFEYATKLYWG